MGCAYINYLSHLCFRDRCRTTSNVLSACYTVAVTEKICHSVTELHVLKKESVVTTSDDYDNKAVPGPRMSGKSFIKESQINFTVSGDKFVSNGGTRDDQMTHL